MPTGTTFWKYVEKFSNTKKPFIMADNNRNWSGNRSSNQDWDDNNNRYGNDDDRNYSRSRYEGGHGQDWNRSGQDYGQGSSSGDSRYDRDSDRYSNYGGSNYGGQSNYDRNSNYGERDYSNYGSSSDRSGRRGERGNVGAGFGFGESGSFRSRYDRERQSYSPGGYQNYGGGSGYGSNQWTGGHGGSSYGRNLGNNYGSGYGSSDYSSGGYGGGLNESYGRGESGSGYGERGYGSGSWGGSYGDRNYGNNWERRSHDRDRGRNDDRGWWDRTADEVSSWFGDEDAERRRRMDKMHKGRGPKNYQRSDERIKEDINDRLSDDWFVDASDIDVTVQSGEVTLAGTVDERTSKRRAEDIAESVSGVKHVENRLRVSSNQNAYAGGSDTSRSYGTESSTSNTGAATGTTGMASGTTSTSRTKTVSENK